MLQDPPVERPQTEDRQPGAVRLFAGMVVAPFAWALHVLITYGFSAYACYPTDRALAAPLWPGLRPALGGVTVASWLLLAAGCAIAWANWRLTRGRSDAGPHHIVQTGDGRARFMALCGLMVSVLFAVALLFTSAGLLLVPDCGP